MTYCVAMSLHEGMLFASDSRTNAGVDNVSTFSKMNVFEVPEGPHQRCIVAVNAGNLATTQGVVSQLMRKASQATGEEKHILNLPSMFDVAEHFGQMMKATISHVEENQLSQSAVDFTCTFLVGGQIRGEAPRLFLIYPQGNFIEATSDTPYFQIGESKYGKPIIDRVIGRSTELADATKCVLVSFDSTMRSNLSVGMPIDLICYERDSLVVRQRRRFVDGDIYFTALSNEWSEGTREVFRHLPDLIW